MTPERLMVPSTDGVSVALHHFGGSGPSVILCHATGFHGRTWDPVAEALASKFDCWAMDLRGHGDSVVPEGLPIRWPDMAADVLAVVDYIGVEARFAVGHSLGGTVIVQAELARPGTFSRAYLFEPILYPDASHDTHRAALTAGARRRTETFESHEAAYRRYAGGPPLNNFDPRALRAYVDHGFRPVNDGVLLKCRGETEAAIFESTQYEAFYRLGEIGIAVVVASGGEDFGPAAIAESAVARFANATLERDPALNHFGPMEQPDLIAGRIADHLLGLG